jgi:hypothetical protein
MVIQLQCWRLTSCYKQTWAVCCSESYLRWLCRPKYNKLYDEERFTTDPYFLEHKKVHGHTAAMLASHILLTADLGSTIAYFMLDFFHCASN